MTRLLSFIGALPARIAYGLDAILALFQRRY